MIVPRTARAAALALLLAAAACGSPAPKERYFTLAVPDRAGPPPAADKPGIFVGPVSVPEAVDRTQMVLATGPNQVDVSDDDRWAELPRNAIARAIAQTLGRELGTSRVFSSRSIRCSTLLSARASVARKNSPPVSDAIADSVFSSSSPRMCV